MAVCSSSSVVEIATSDEANLPIASKTKECNHLKSVVLCCESAIHILSNNEMLMNLGMRNRLSGSASLLLMSKVGLVFPSTVHKLKRRKSMSAASAS
jgi:hypothetical protein